MKRLAPLLILIIPVNVSAQQPPDKNETPKSKFVPKYETRKEHDPYGTGKFYMGREIAHVMGFQGAGWLERPTREKEEQASKLIPALKVTKGDFVADIGAGSGFHTMNLSRVVGPKGKVYAVDVQPQMLKIIKNRIDKNNIKNIELVQGTITDPKLPEAKLDLILMVDVYHEFSHPYTMAVELVKSLKPGGRLVFVEFRLEDPKVPILNVHRMSERQVLKEMEPHPVRHVETIGTFPWQHIIIFERVAKKEE